MFLYINSLLNDFVWGPVVISFMVGIGVYFTVFTKFFHIRHFGYILKSTIGNLKKASNKDEKNISPFQAVSTALAGTIGTGNIAGVATAIVSGGPGAIFWMWISAIFGMMTKYAEIVLAVKYRTVNEKGEYSGGPMHYIEKGIGVRWAAVLFASLCVLASFGIGNMAQSNSIAEAMYEAFDVPPYISGILVSVICGFVLLGGVKRISKIAEKIVPFMALFYMLGSAFFLILNASQIMPALFLIIKSAFNPQSTVGGIMGYTVKQAMHFGISRGVFTNEAGLGSAPIAHACSSNKDPVTQGMWGIFEVFFDTIIMCTVTTLVILTANGGTLWQSGLDGTVLTTKAFSTCFGEYGTIFIAISIVFFAIASVLGWALYGEKSILYITKGRGSALVLYRSIFIAMLIVGATVNLQTVWSISDTLNGLMAIPNLIALLVLSPVVIKITNNYIKNLH